MAINYRFLMDWDGDGFSCKDARPGDNINLLPGSAKINTLKYQVVGAGSSVTSVGTANPYGRSYLQFTASASTHYVDIGFNGAEYNLTGAMGLQYSGALWARVTSGTMTVKMSVRSPAASLNSEVNTTLTTDWQQLVMSASNTLSSQTNLFLRLTANSAGTIQISGPMITQGSAPAAFNTSPVSLYDDISVYVQDARWNVGFKNPFQYVSDWERASITVRNDNFLFSPEYPTSPIYSGLKPQRKMTIVASSDNVSETVMFTGWISAIKTQPGSKNERNCILEFAGVRQFIDGTEVDVQLQIGKSAEQIAYAVMEKVETPDFDLGVLDPGVDASGVVYPYAGENWQEGIDVLRALNDITRARQGKILFDREGQYAFFNPRSYAGNSSTVVTLGDEISRIDYRYGEDIKNKVVVMRYERTITAEDNMLLWQTKDFVLEPNETQTIQARYKNGNASEFLDDNITVGGHEVEMIITPVTGVTTLPLEAKAQSAKITVTNTTNTEVTIPTIRLRGQKLTAFDEAEAHAEDVTSIGEYGKIVDRIDSKLVNKGRHAHRIARYRLAQFKNPQGIVRSVSFAANRSTVLEDAAVQYGVSSTTVHRIQIQEEQLNHDRVYALIGEEHQVNKSGTLHQVTWFLEPATNVITLNDTIFGKLNDNFIGLY